MSRFTKDIEYLREVVKDATCFADIFRAYGIKGTPATYYGTLKNDFANYNIDYSHFNANNNRAKVLRQNGVSKRVSLEDILSNKAWQEGNHIKKKLFAENIKEKKCEECGQNDIWNGKPLTLQLDHVDGNNRNNFIENLKILCPNCHTQTSTYSRKK